MKPEPLNEDEIQQAFKTLYDKGFTGRNMEEAFAREIEAEVNARWEAMLAGQKPVAWLYTKGKERMASTNYVAGVRAKPLYLAPQPAQQEPEIAMVDAAMVEMKNITPPLRRSECLRLIRAALSAAPQPAQQEPVAWVDRKQGAVSFMKGEYGSGWEPLYAAPVQQDRTTLLRQALEGFENLQRQYKEHPSIYIDWSKAREAITAIREALK